MLNNVIGVLAPTTPLVTNSYESIETFTVGSGGSASITFGSGGTIPQTYKHLQIRCISKSSNTIPTQIDVTFNGDTGANYSWHELAGNGSSAFADNSINRNNIVGFPAITATGSTFGAGVMDILDYTNTNKYTTTRALVGHDLNGSGTIALDSGSWRNTAAITSITLTGRSYSIGQYSSFALYGIKG